MASFSAPSIRECHRFSNLFSSSKNKERPAPVTGAFLPRLLCHRPSHVEEREGFFGRKMEAERLDSFAKNQEPRTKEDASRKMPGIFFSVRVGDHYRAIAWKLDDGGVEWVWIGSHAEYDQLLKRK